MNYKNGNYTAFYVNEPFSESALGAFATHDFVFYNMLRAWKGSDKNFPFNDSHDKTYNVRDDSSWEYTLKPRLRERLNKSKNIILFLSDITKNSRALREEIEYGINSCGLPIIVIYPDFKVEEDLLDSKKENLNKSIINLWSKIPAFRDNKSKVPILHIPLNKTSIKKALEYTGLMVNSKTEPNDYFYK